MNQVIHESIMNNANKPWKLLVVLLISHILYLGFVDNYYSSEW